MYVVTRHRLVVALRMPEFVRGNNGTTRSRAYALLILLNRLGYANRWVTIEALFKEQRRTLQAIFATTVDLLYYEHLNVLHTVDTVRLQPLLPRFAAAVKEQTGVDRCIGFIDGKFFGMCRPTEGQESVYNGHKKGHGFQQQGVVTPDGIMIQFYGPVEGRHHDSYLLGLSEFEDQMSAWDQDYYVYGDPAYGLSTHIQAPFDRISGSDVEQEYNASMSRARVSVEHVFGRIIKLFAFVDWKKKLQMMHAPVGKFITIAALLTNCHSCLNPNQVSQNFGVAPPVLEDYLRTAV